MRGCRAPQEVAARSKGHRVTAGILIIHTPGQLDDASTLVDLLEASLELPTGAIACSSLPGYAWANRASSEPERSERFSVALEGATAAIALVDGPSFADPQLWFDIAAAWSRGKRVAIVADCATRRSQVPLQLAGNGNLIERDDREALVSLIEDLAFDLGVRPRIGQDAQRALELLSSAPPSAPSSMPPRAADLDVPTVRAVVVMPSLDAVPFALEQTAPVDLAAELEPEPDAEPIYEADEPYELNDQDVEQVGVPDGETHGVSCQLSLEAGRAISECSFHRETQRDVTDLERSFGCFVDAVGGNWLELKRLGDTELWMGATDNLLETLQPDKRYIADWYEVGFQFAALQNIAEQGVPQEPEQRAIYQDVWTRSMEAFQRSAQSAAMPARELRRQRALLENLIGPETLRDYANAELSLSELRALAEAADRQGAA